MIRKLLFLSQILNARELGSKNDPSDARFDGLFQKTLAFEEIELSEDDLIWAEKTYGYGDKTGAFYSPKNIPEEFFLLGDKLCRYGSDDCKNLISVKDISSRGWNNENALIKPTHAFLQWQDANQLNEVAVSVFVLEAERGYQCVGDVAVKGKYSELPAEIMNRYRCVKNGYLEHIPLGRYFQFLFIMAQK